MSGAGTAAGTGAPGPGRTSMSRAVLAELSRPRGPVDRLRARASTAAAAGIGTALLAAASIAGVRDSLVTGTYTVQDELGRASTVTERHPPGGLAPFLAQPGLRPGAVLAALLLVLPFAALAVQALRVGSVALQRRAELLALAGATPSDLRRVRVRRTAGAFARGGALAGPLLVLLWLAVGVLPPAGSRLLPAPRWWLLLAWIAVVAVLAGAGAALGAASSAGGQARPLTSRTRRPLPPRWLAVGALVGAAALVGAGLVAPVRSTVLLDVFLVGLVLLLLTAAWTIAVRAAAGSGSRRRPRLRRRGPAGGAAARDVLASAQRRGDPRAAAAVGGVLFVCGLSFGVESGLSSYLLDTLGHGTDRSDLPFYLGGTALAGAVGLVAGVVATLALGLALTDHLLTARRSVASTAALGAEHSHLVEAQVLVMRRATAPSVVAGVLLGGLPYAMRAITWHGPAATLGTAVVAGLVVALACRVVAQALSGRVRAAAALEHLRVP